MKNIYDLYNNKKYLNIYGIDFLITFTIILLIFSIFIYFHIDNIKKPIIADWPNKKCYPYVIPFAGYINNTTSKSNFQFTIDNFNECISSEIKEMSQETLKPYNYLINVKNNVDNGLNNSMNDIRNQLSNIRSSFSNITNMISDKIYLFVLPLVQITIHLKSFLNKSVATTLIPVYTLQSITYAMKSLFRQMIIPTILVIIGIFVTGVAELFIPFVGWIIGPITIALGIVASLLIIPFVEFVSNILVMSMPSVPRAP